MISCGLYLGSPHFILPGTPLTKGLAQQTIYTMNEVLMTILLLIAGLACFWLFYKSIDFFDNI
ncbi:hypothetical protein [Pontibacter rugosus]